MEGVGTPPASWLPDLLPDEDELLVDVLLGDMDVDWSTQLPDELRFSDPSHDSLADGTNDPSERRRARQLELHHLRETSKRMELELGRLNAQRENIEGSASAPRSWKDIALDTAQARTRALQENLHLKRLLEEQLVLTQAIQAILKVPPLLPATPCTLSIVSASLAPSFPQRLLDMRQLVAAQYAKLDSVLLRAKLMDASSPTEYRLANMTLLPLHDSISIDVHRRRRFPFPVKAVADATWHAWTHMALDDTPHSRLLAYPATNMRYIRVPMDPVPGADVCPVFGQRSATIVTQEIFHRIDVSVTKVVLVGVAVLQDPALSDSTALLAGSNTWIVIEQERGASPDEDTPPPPTVYSCVVERFPPVTRDGKLHSLPAMLARLGLGSHPGMLSEYLLRSYMTVMYSIERDIERRLDGTREASTRR